MIKMSKLVNWEWEKEKNESNDMEDMFTMKKQKIEPPIPTETRILNKNELEDILIKSDLRACEDAFDFK
jgi:hypothetical protein